MNIRSSYAESKRMGELLTAIWSKQYNVCGLVVRPFHTYGPSLYLDDGRVFSDFVSNIVNKIYLTNGFIFIGIISHVNCKI